MQSRYYNTEWGRFVNADAIVGEKGELLSHNMFTYTLNNPVNFEDQDGFNATIITKSLEAGLILVITTISILTYTVNDTQRLIHDYKLNKAEKTDNENSDRTKIRSKYPPAKRIRYNSKKRHMKRLKRREKEKNQYIIQMVNMDLTIILMFQN